MSFKLMLFSTGAKRDTLEFIVTASSLGAGDSAGRSVTSSIAQNMYIDYGDGTDVTIALAVNTQYRFNKTYTGGFVSPAEKLVKIRFDDPTKIYNFQIGSWACIGNLDTNIEILSSVIALTIGSNNFSTFPNNLQKLSVMTQLAIQSMPSLGGILPDQIFGLSALQTLSANNNSIGSLTLTQANYERLNEITTITDLTISNNSLTALPNNIVGCTNLVTISMGLNTSMSTSLPSGFNALTKLKTFNANGCFNTVTRVNEWVDTIYTLVTSNAPITGSSVDIFRSMSLNFTGSVPTGTEQAPTGYVLGSSNGTPASQKEKIYVLKNQYSHTITYTP